MQPLSAVSAWTGSDRDSTWPAGPALQNNAREYNCFLNAVLQLLWSCRDFRVAVLGTPAHIAAGEHALTIFRHWSRSEMGNEGLQCRSTRT